MKFIEATLIYPVSILIIMSLISLMMSFYSGLENQITEHDSLRADVFKARECTAMRIYDKIETLS